MLLVLNMFACTILSISLYTFFCSLPLDFSIIEILQFSSSKHIFFFDIESYFFSNKSTLRYTSAIFFFHDLDSYFFYI